MSIQTSNKTELQIFNLGSGKSHSVKELIDTVRNFTKIEIEYLCTNEQRQNEVLDTVADVSKIKSVLNWTPIVSLKEGLIEMFEE